MKKLISHILVLLIFLLKVGQLYAQDLSSLTMVDSRIMAANRQIIVINIWDTKSPNEFIKLNSLKKKYEKENVIFLSITDEEDTQVNQFLKNHPFNYDQISSPEREKIFNQFQTGMFKTFPIHIIIDPNGEVSFKKKNNPNNIELKLARRIDQLLKNYSSDKLRNYDYQYVTNKNFHNK